MFGRHPRREASMKRDRRVLIVRALSLVTLTGCWAVADTSPDSTATAAAKPAASNWVGDSAAIVAAIASSREAWNRADVSAHYAIFSDSVALVFNDPKNPPIRTLADVRSHAPEAFPGGKPVALVNGEPILVKPLGPDAAVTVGRATI